MVPHRPREDEQGGGEAGEVGDERLERVRRGVFDEDVVEEGACADGGEHGRGGCGDCIGAKIKGCRSGGCPVVLRLAIGNTTVCRIARSSSHLED